jgi:hypothetical protein
LLTSFQIEKITDYVKKGVAPPRAARACGIGPKEWSEIETRAYMGREPESTFMRSVGEAEAEWEAGMVEGISASNDWRAKVAILEKRFNERYGNKIQIEVRGELEKALRIAEETIPEEHYIRFLQRLAGESAIFGSGTAEKSSGPATQLN